MVHVRGQSLALIVAGIVSTFPLLADDELSQIEIFETIEIPFDPEMMPQDAGRRPPQLSRTQPLRAPDRIDEYLVTNRGDYAWEILRKSTPVLGNQFNFANALPSGVRSERNLSDWGEKQNRSFTIRGKNLLGSEVFFLNFVLSYKAGGQVDGKGRYLGTVTVVAADFSSWWGYSVDFRVCGVTVGATERNGEAVARMGMQLCMKVSTVLRTIELNQLLVIDGSSADVVVKPAVWNDRVNR